MTHWISTLTVFFYITTIISVFFTKNIKIWGSFSGIAIGLALYAKHLSILSLPNIFIIIASIYFYYKGNTTRTKIVSSLTFITLCLIAVINKIPGTKNWTVIDNVLLSPDATPLNTYFEFDAVLFGLSFILFGVPNICNKSDLRNIVKKLSVLIPIMLIVIISLSILTGYVKWDPKWSSLFFVWSLSNLFFTCIIEETLFRHFFQKGLQSIFHEFKYGDYLGIMLASILFGVAHYAGGILYVCLASVAGLFYGFAYHLTGRIEASIVSHYILNATHFIFFTYPVLAAVSP